MILILRKRPYAGLPAVSAGLIALVAGNMLLVPAMRLNGAALAAVLAIAVWSLAAWHAARREENLDVSIFPLIKAMMSRP
jgi:O-antigen/teichoic acid export membrane protein